MKLSLTVDVTEEPDEKGFFVATGVYRDSDGNWTNVEMKSFGRSQMRAAGFFISEFGEFLKQCERNLN